MRVLTELEEGGGVVDVVAVCAKEQNAERVAAFVTSYGPVHILAFR
jgi:hypothetical protein